MIVEIKKNTLNNIVDTLQCDFSTTNKIEQYISTATIMNSFKQYFKYGRCIPCCGITEVKFAGKLEDWEKLVTKTKNLEQYAINEKWTNYVKNVVPILEKFIDTYNGKVDVEWWNKIFNITSGRIGSGSTSYYSGWLLNFYGLYDKHESGDISSGTIGVPVELKNMNTGKMKMLEIVGGFGGV